MSVTLRTVMAALCVNLLTVNMFLSIFFLPGDLADCPDRSKLFITAPKKMEALSGSCLHIPCNFTAKPEDEFDSTRPTFGVWMKNDSRFANIKNNAVFNSSGTVNKYPMNITGNLRQKNCSTLFSNLTTSHTDTYFFRINNGPYRRTALCDPLQITVKDSPWSPSIHISAGVLTEKQSVSITCSALTPCPHSPPQLTWNLHPDSHSETEENTDGTFTTKLQQTITLSHTHDGYNISCSATYPVNGGRNKTAETKQTLSGRSKTFVKIVLSVGSQVNLTCSCRANPPVSSFLWFRISDGRLEIIKANAQVYSFKVTSRDRDVLFYCGCRQDADFQLSAARQLILEGHRGGAGVQVIVKTLGIIILVCTVIVFECWFRSTRSKQAGLATPCDTSTAVAWTATNAQTT
ncbi:myelin-associated glycoprotein-like [Parambassis ranga]|uniref:Myelin-associated glycoprotein-like n=1 Tax=Parambassis ranga TaxID=210632 RepID=A0A6P7KIK5_9TELE|nr:myelin-associated glycoprotein-like [Parambassis ranga]